MHQPLISIIVPIYNVEKYLDECVKSIVNQTYKNLEIILVDDGSPDSCPQKCDEWSAKDKRIKVLHKPNGGLSDARNAGIEASKGEFIMFVDSDDFVKDNIVGNLYSLLIKTTADVTCCGIFKYKNGESYPVYNEYIKSDVSFTGLEQLKNILNLRTDFSAWGKLYRREAIGNHRFIKGRYNEDIIFLFELYQSCNLISYTNNRFYYYRDTEGSITNTVSNRTMDALKNANEMEAVVISKNLPVIDDIKNYKCRTYLEIGYSIQRANAQKSFPQETKSTKKHTIQYFGYMLGSRYYNWRDIAHAIINIFRL